MKLIIEIPKEFVCDYEADRFEDCFQRFICDSKTGLMAGNYERETAEMLIKAFKNTKEVVSCKDCKWSYTDEATLICGYRGFFVNDMFYCGDGKRREE